MSEVEELAAKLNLEGDRFRRYLVDRTEDQWGAQVYSEGSVWTIRDTLAHLVSSERAFVRLFGEISRGGPGVSEDFSIDRYNARQQEKMKAIGPAQLLVLYQTTRAAMVSFVLGLTDVDLDKQGRHPFLGKATLREMIKMIHIHNQTHARDVRRALGG